MKKQEYKKAIVATAVAGMVLTGSGASAVPAHAQTSSMVDKAVRKSKRLENLRHHREDKELKKYDERHESHKVMRTDIRTALEQEDYASFKNALANHPKAQKISEEQFSVLSEAYKLMKEGKKAEAKKLLKTLKLQKSVRGMVIGFIGFDRLTK